MGGAAVHASLCTKPLALETGLAAARQQPGTIASLDTPGRLAGAGAALQLEQPPGCCDVGFFFILIKMRLKKKKGKREDAMSLS